MANLERERKEDAVKEEISGEPIRKPVFKIKRPKRKKKFERQIQKTKRYAIRLWGFGFDVKAQGGDVIGEYNWVINSNNKTLKKY